MVVVLTNITATARRSYDSLNQKNVRWPQGDRGVTSRFLQLKQVCRTAAVRAPWGRRKDAVKPPYYFLDTLDRVKTVCHLTAVARRPYGHRTMTMRCGCGIAVSEKVWYQLKKTQGLWWPCGVLKSVRSPYGLHKNRKVTVRVGRLRSPYGGRKHAASYMWPWL